MNTSITANRIKAARLIAIAADFLQIAVFPLFLEGLLSPINDALDVLVCILLTWLVGWHFAFLPSFLVKFVPMADLAPTWTIAILFATRQKSVSSDTSNVTEVYAEATPLPPQLPETRSQAK
ncbi:MAG TPA: hypothetical protein VFB72_14770 [Verrucomicrobiae bacterium]|nr:hypothetical protein [Verrucomicrobiae bacterium]